MKLEFTAKKLCAILAVLGAAAFALMFDAAPPAQAGAVPIRSNHRAAIGPSSPLTTTRTVTTNADSGVGSLRQAIADAAAGDTINFSMPYPVTITLTSAELLINQDLTISGPGASNLAVRNSNIYRIFDIGSGNVTISGITIREGFLNADFGGGIYNAGTLTLTNSTVVTNTAIYGGGIYNTGTLHLSNSTVIQNRGFTVAGGIYNAGQLAIDSSSVVSNTSVAAGIDNYGALTITNSTLSGNVGSVSGIYSQGNSTVVMTNTTLSENLGEALFLFSNGSGAVSASLWNSDIISNTDTGIEMNVVGSGVTSTLSLHNSIVANNGGNGNFDILSGTVTSLGYNLSNGTIPKATTGDRQNVTNLLVAPLANNGGATRTHALLPGSPAINAGSNSGCPATDQRGVTRPRTAWNPCDIGSFEVTMYPLFLPLIKK